MWGRSCLGAASTLDVDKSAKQVASSSQGIRPDMQQVSRVMNEVSVGMDELRAGASGSRESVAELSKLAAEMRVQTEMFQGILRRSDSSL